MTFTITEHNWNVAVNHPLASEWLKWLSEPKKPVEAIKAVRRLCNLGLKEAKDVVEYHLDNHPVRESRLGDILREQLEKSGNVQRRVREYTLRDGTEVKVTETPDGYKVERTKTFTAKDGMALLDLFIALGG